jgi:hypothetical protein
MRSYYVGQAMDQGAQWDQQLNEDASAEFQRETGRSQPDDFVMKIVWLTFKYAAINRRLAMAEGWALPPPPDPTTGASAPVSAPTDPAYVRWLTEYKRILNQYFADNPTFDQLARDAMAKIQSQRGANAVRGWR